MRRNTRNAANPSGSLIPRRLRPVGGLLLGGTLLLACSGARSLTDSEAVSSQHLDIVAFCSAPGQPDATCGGERVQADVIVRRTTATPARPVPGHDDATGAALGAAAAAVPTEPPTTVAPAPEASPAPEAAAADQPAAADDQAQDAPAPEDAQPQDTPPTTRKPKKAAPAPTAPTAPPATEAPAPPADTAAPAPPAAPVRVDTSVTGRFVALVNAQRAAAGLPGVSASGALSSAAARQSKDQAAHHVMTHAGSDGSTVGSRASAAGYAWRGLGENVAAGQGSADSAMSAWMNSAPHRANIMNAAYVNIGVAVAYADDGTPYWTMDLGAPA